MEILSQHAMNSDGLMPVMKDHQPSRFRPLKAQVEICALWDNKTVYGACIDVAGYTGFDGLCKVDYLE